MTSPDDLSTLTDQQLAERIRAGDERAHAYACELQPSIMWSIIVNIGL
jgi:hypothetical protein